MPLCGLIHSGGGRWGGSLNKSLTKVCEMIASELEPLTHVSPEDFKEGMAVLSGAVNIVTTDGPGGRAGLTASAVCSVTAEPPTLLVCVNRGSSAAPAFLQNDAICVNTVGPDHKGLAMLFGGKTPMEDRFATADWTEGPSGAPVLGGQGEVADTATARDLAARLGLVVVDVTEIGALSGPEVFS